MVKINASCSIFVYRIFKYERIKHVCGVFCVTLLWQRHRAQYMPLYMTYIWMISYGTELYNCTISLCKHGYFLHPYLYICISTHTHTHTHTCLQYCCDSNNLFGAFCCGLLDCRFKTQCHSVCAVLEMF